jgi:hypothetical protein
MQGSVDFATEFAWDQLVVGCTALILAVRFGSYAATSVRQFENARHDQESERIRSAFIPLLLELQDNRVNLLVLEGRLSIPGVLAWRLRPGLQRKIYDALLAGPLWQTSETSKVIGPIADTYREMAELDYFLQPPVPWWSVLIIVPVSALLSQYTWSERGPRAYRWVFLVGMLLALADVFLPGHISQAIGRVSRVRQKVEDAIDCVYRDVLRQPTPWATIDGELRHGVSILPERPCRTKMPK